MKMRTSVALLLLLAADCSMSLISAASPPSISSDKPDFKAWAEEKTIKDGVRAADRKEMVRPAAKGFRPESMGRRLRATLVARDKTIHLDGHFWYRLELQNIGSEPLQFREEQSFLKDGGWYTASRWRFFCVLPNGDRRALNDGMRYVDEFARSDSEWRRRRLQKAEGMTEEQTKRLVDRINWRHEADIGLDVTLAPGETLVSRPWRWVDLKEFETRIDKGERELQPRPSGTFRELWTSLRFNAPGTYKIQAVYEDLPLPPPSEEHLREMEELGVPRSRELANYKEDSAAHLGRVESNVVVIQALP